MELLALLVASALAIRCRNENNAEVEWFIALKYPELPDAESGYNDGYTYYYLDSDNYSSFREGVTKLSNSKKGALSYTFQEIYSRAGDSDFGYAMYNDDPPDPYSDSTYRAHAKGVIAVDDMNEGIWLVHSTPRYPYHPKDHAYEFPSIATDYGQAYLCMSLTGSSMNAVGNILYYDMPNFYAKEIPSSLQGLYPALYDAVMNDSHTTSAATTQQYLSFVGKPSIRQALAFGKTKAWGQDLWDDLIAPSLGTDMVVETWIRGGDLASQCSGFMVVDVTNVKVGKYGWPETKDHSKYGLTMRASWGGDSEGDPWVCVGDINRMESQRERGGGAVCFQNSKLWSAFDALIQGAELC